MICRDGCLREIDAMSKEIFRKKIVQGAMKSDIFATAMALGIENLPEEHQKELCDVLVTAGIPVTYPTDPMDRTILQEIFGAIICRAMDVQ